MKLTLHSNHQQLKTPPPREIHCRTKQDVRRARLASDEHVGKNRPKQTAPHFQSVSNLLQQKCYSIHCHHHREDNNEVSLETKFQGRKPEKCPKVPPELRVNTTLQRMTFKRDFRETKADTCLLIHL